ncbi:hypothetical protein NQF87_00780 [Bombella sp. TMW 2.2559]|uniref:Uncharacterized protein n=1 Tax=Bombella dulcis TaxID=2967339 RepID=A0ABT3W8X4_9PROT|nr:hypothetical protein [Bombella dulcis]MCX5615520.1 hypothetical protein [Bombella dulcis]
MKKVLYRLSLLCLYATFIQYAKFITDGLMRCLTINQESSIGAFSAGVLIYLLVIPVAFINRHYKQKNGL